jgi:ribonucleotide reductase alpha subunit
MGKRIVQKGSNPEYINAFSSALLDGFYLKEGETFDDALARAAEAFCFGDYELAQRIYDAAWNGWFMFASPILSNAPKGSWKEPDNLMEREWFDINDDTSYITNYFNGEDTNAMPISCLTGDMPINTYNGIKYMSDLEVGDLVLTHTGNWKPVEEIWTRQSTNDLYELVAGTRSTKIKITGNHPVKTNLGWIRVDELDLNKHLIAVNNTVNFRKSQAYKIDLSKVEMPKNGNSTSFTELERPLFVEVDGELAWALGLWFAEGSIARDNKGLGNGLKITMSIDEQDIIEDWIAIISDRFGVTGNLSVVTDKRGNSWCNGWVSGARLARYFDSEFGPDAKTKQIPEWIIDLDNDMLDLFLGGFIDGDGSINMNNDAKITISNPYLLGGIYNIALKLGHPVSMNFTGKKGKYSTTRYVYSLTLREWQLSRNKKTVSAGVEFEDGLVYCPIRSISKLNENDTVYDIRVAEDHSFSVAGVVVHNCFAQVAPDTIVGQMDANRELAALSVAGGGVGIHNLIRATSDKAPGPIPYMKTMDGLIGYYQQSKNRRGACAYYMDVSHPDIVEHIRFRVPSGGDSARKSDNRKQFHSAVNITDAFIEAVLSDSEFNLVCPHSGEVRETVRARELWEEILEVRALTGEPYLMKIDTVNRALPESQKKKGLRVNGSNICLSGSTRLLTDNGLVKIEDLDGKTFNVFNGDGEMKPSFAFKTSEKEKVFRLTLNNGQVIDLTGNHILEVRKVFGDKNRYHEYVEMEAQNMVGELVTPFLGNGYWKGSYEINELTAQLYGFIQGDGTFEKWDDGKIHAVTIRNSEPEVKSFIFDNEDHFGYNITIWSDGTIRLAGKEFIYGLEDFGFDFRTLPERNLPESIWSLSSKLTRSFLNGLFSANGTAMEKYNRIAHLGTCEQLSVDLQNILIALGFPAYRTEGEPQEIEWPNGTYTSKPNFVVNISSKWAFEKFQQEIGFLHNHKMIESTLNGWREGTVRSSRVKSVEYIGEFEVYDFNEKETHWGWANGFKTHNCSEIVLPSDEERTFVCCLSSLNLEKYDEWADTTLVADLVTYLDNVIQYFIEKAPAALDKARYSALQERAIGIGTMGWHYYLQSKGISMEGGGFGSAIQQTHIMFSNIKQQAVEQTEKLAVLRGEPNDMIGSGRRNSHLLAIAPNSNNAIILGTSPAIEPISGNTYSHSTRAGTFMVKNPYLEKVLENIASTLDEAERDEWLDRQWKDIISHDGSVQHLDYLTVEEKNVFKTAFEIDQHWLVEQADARQQYVCQAQSLNLFFPAGVDRNYFNSVHLKAMTAPYLKTLYYSRMERGINADVVKEIERKTITDWAGDDCVSCSG